MQVCLMIETEDDVTWSQWVRLAEQCERHGLSGLFGADHYGSVYGRRERGSLDVWTVLAALAARTRQIRLGTLVSPVTFRHPSVLAKVVTTVDHISGGRVELGLGAGRYEPEHRAYGFRYPPVGERLGMLAEYLRIIHGQWTEESVTFEGEHFRLEDCVARFRPLQQPHPPLIVGGRGGPRSIEIAARWADEYNVAGLSPEECRKIRRRLTEACERHGRDPRTLRLSYLGACLAGADGPELRRRTWHVLERTGAWGTSADEFLNRMGPDWIAGTVDRVMGRLDALRDADVHRVYLHHLLPDDLDMIELIGRVVVPAMA